jgi:hypothetical protein
MGHFRHHPLPRILPPSNEPGEPSTYFRHALGDQDPTPAKTDNMPQKLGVVPLAEYPAASGPWSDPVAASLNAAPDTVGADPGFNPGYWQAPVVGESHEIAEGRSSRAEKPASTANSPPTLTALRHAVAAVDLQMRQQIEWSPRLDELQAERDRLEAEIRRLERDER